MNRCAICNEEILKDSQYINGKYYHNCCIEDLQKQNADLKEEVKRCEKANVILDNETTELTEENERLKNNWNELKKMIEDTIIASHKIAINPDDEFFQISNGTFYRVLNMMQELEEKEVK